MAGFAESSISFFYKKKAQSRFIYFFLYMNFFSQFSYNYIFFDFSLTRKKILTKNTYKYNGRHFFLNKMQY